MAKTQRNFNYAGAKPGTTATNLNISGRLVHKHRMPIYDEESLRSHYLKKYRKELRKAKSKGDKVSIKFFKAGINYWLNRGKDIPERLRQKAETVQKAVTLAGGKHKFKEAVGIKRTNRCVDHMINYRILGRDKDKIDSIYFKAHDWLCEHAPNETM